jgi:hypothetical protein
LEVSVRRFVKPVLMIVALGVAALPIILVVSLGWYHTPLLGDPMGPGSGVIVVTLVFSVVWVLATMVVLVWLLDRLGVHYTVDRREPQPGRKEPSRKRRRRQRAGLELLATQQRARTEAEQESARRRSSPPPAGGGHGRPEGL